MKRPIGIQLYSVRDAAAENLSETLKRISKIGFQGVEFAGFHNHSVTEVTKMLEDNGLKAMSIFSDLPTDENISRIADEMRVLGIKICIAGFGPTDMDTREKVHHCAEKLKRGLALLQQEGLTLAIHNHWWEFAYAYEGKTTFEIIMTQVPELGSELDIYWSTKGGADTKKLLKTWAGRFPQLHVKDGDLSDDNRFCEIGGGKIATREILQATDSSIENLIVEQDTSEINIFESIRRSFDWLVENGFGNRP